VSAQTRLDGRGRARGGWGSITSVAGACVPWVVTSPTLDPHSHREKRLFPIESIAISYRPGGPRPVRLTPLGAAALEQEGRAVRLATPTRQPRPGTRWTRAVGLRVSTRQGRVGRLPPSHQKLTAAMLGADDAKRRKDRGPGLAAAGGVGARPPQDTTMIGVSEGARRRAADRPDRVRPKGFEPLTF
jgi:hypothetical protein